MDNFKGLGTELNCWSLHVRLSSRAYVKLDIAACVYNSNIEVKEWRADVETGAAPKPAGHSPATCWAAGSLRDPVSKTTV